MSSAASLPCPAAVARCTRSSRCVCIGVPVLSSSLAVTRAAATPARTLPAGIPPVLGNGRVRTCAVLLLPHLLSGDLAFCLYCGVFLPLVKLAFAKAGCVAGSWRRAAFRRDYPVACPCFFGAVPSRHPPYLLYLLTFPGVLALRAPLIAMTSSPLCIHHCMMDDLSTWWETDLWHFAA